MNSSLHPRRRRAISIRAGLVCVGLGAVLALVVFGGWLDRVTGVAPLPGEIAEEPQGEMLSSATLADGSEAAPDSVALASGEIDPTLAEPADAEDTLGVIQGRMKPGDSLVVALGRHGVGPKAASQIAVELGPLFDFRNARPGDHYWATLDAAGRIIDFRYVNYAEEVLRLSWTGDEYVADIEDTEFVTRRSRIAGVIETSLYDAIASLGEKPFLASNFAQLFIWEVDINTRANRGDVFQAIYERRYRIESDGSENYLGPGRILAARYVTDENEHTAVYFAPIADHAGGYYRPDGTSLEREFLANPVELGRIASSWSAARFHPILKVTRPHHGIDYAAPVGTPVWAAARGTVAYRGWAQGFGNLVKIRHDNGYLTYYGHLSRFAKNLKVGQRLKQKDVIGYVGATGLATGPHVCFRVRKDGRYVNPLTLEAPAAAEIAKADRARFRDAMDDLLGTLDSRHLASAGGDKAL